MCKFIKGLFLLSALAGSVGLTGCSDESPWRGSDSEGGITLSLSADGRVMRQTRADDSVADFVPESSAFSVSLSNSDGSYSKKWSTLEDFNRESAFPMGDYTLTAIYGDAEQEGFELPCFAGTTPVHVSPGSDTDVSVVATLANCMVSVRYTEAFRQNFPAFSASVRSEGHERVVFAQDEERPAYMSPSEMKLNLSLTNDRGEQVTIEPATFTALARHHYVVTVGVEGNSSAGDLTLDIIFDDDVVAETVEVPLGDELFTAPAPVVTPKGFSPDTKVEGFEYVKNATPLEMHAFAFGGLRSATLNIISSNGHVPSFGRSVELVNAEPAVQQKLEAEGVVAAGFYKNADKMGFVNLTDFIAHLPAGEYEIELNVVDAMTRASEPVSLSVALAPIEMDVLDPQEIDFLSTEIPLKVSTNYAPVKDQLVFMAPDESNKLVKAAVKSVTLESQEGGRYVYSYVLTVAPVSKSPVDVQVVLGDLRKTVLVPVNIPEFTLEADAFARKIRFRLTGPEEDKISKIRNNLVFYNGDSAIPTANVTHEADGIITVSGFKPGETYSNLKAKYMLLEMVLPAITTETEENVPNGSFNSVTQTINIRNIKVGGQYDVKVLGINGTYQNFTNIVRSEADGWASLNALTCFTGSNPMNTWFVVPSTYAENGEVVIRSVGYNHNGTLPAKSGGNMNRNYYCENSPTDAQFEKAAGELFLGSYGESRVDGIDFSARPDNLTFRYRYAPYNDEKAEAVVKILAADGTVLASNVAILEMSDEMQTYTQTLSGYPFGKKAAKVIVDFRSTRSGVTPAIYIPKGKELEETDGVDFRKNSAKDNSYHALATGSVLVIDDVSLGYDNTGVVRNSRSKKR